MTKERRNGLLRKTALAGLTGLALLTTGCSGARRPNLASEYDSRKQGSVMITPENFQPNYKRIGNALVSESQRGEAYENMLYNLRYNTRQENFQPFEKEWASSELNRRAFANDVYRRLTKEERLQFGEYVNFNNPSEEDAVFLERYYNGMNPTN